ncbi:hypothetical protein DFJ74DRAFT_771294 [Hyaloraphidium curvatum]|nr:hypothetical protein DFJ74DRAFT_771294 [Hyaloraphidium curvatum]
MSGATLLANSVFNAPVGGVVGERPGAAADEAAPSWELLAAEAERRRQQGPADGDDDGGDDPDPAERKDSGVSLDFDREPNPPAAEARAVVRSPSAASRAPSESVLGWQSLPETPLDWLLNRGVPLAGVVVPASPPPSLGPALPFPDLGPGAPTPQDLLFIAVRRFWSHTHRVLPFVHRGAFERAIKGSPCQSFPRRRPLALLYAIAASGIRHVTDLTHRERLAVARWCSLRARDLLAAVAPQGDLEAVLTATLMCKLLAIAGLPGKTLPLLKLSAVAAEKLFLRLPLEAPITAGEWIYREHVLRARIVVCGFDLGAAHYSARQTFGRYFAPHTNEPVAAPENAFDHPDPEAGFAILRKLRDGHEPRISFPSTNEDDFAPGATRLARDMADLAFSGASALHIIQLANYSRHHLLRMRRDAALDDLPPSRDVGIVVASIPEVAASMLPHEIRIPFAQGNAAPFLDAWETMFLPHPRYSSSLVQMFLFAEFFSVESLLLLGFLRAARARSLRAASLLRCLLSRDPAFEGGTFAVVGACATMGTVLLDALNPAPAFSASGGFPSPEQPHADREASPADLRLGARTFARALDLLGASYGLGARRVADAFLSSLHAAGVAEISANTGEIEEMEEDAGGEGARFSWDGLVRGAQQPVDRSPTGSSVVSVPGSLASSAGSRTSVPGWR